MSKASWGKPGYQGRPDPTQTANKFMFVLILLLVLGFIQASIKNEWFTPIMKFIFS